MTTLEGRPSARPHRRYGSLAVGLALTAGSISWTMSVSYPTGLGTMLGLVLAYAVSAYYVVLGIGRLRGGGETELVAPGGRGDAAWAGRAGERSWRCALVGHRERFVARTDEHPALWECRRCGAQSRTHLSTGHAWICQLPLADHRYDYVGRTDDHPELWRCRRCGKRRYTMPRSAGETLEATNVDKLWIRRGHDN